MKGFLWSAGAALAMAATPAAAAVDLYIYEDGVDLVAFATGTFAVSGLTKSPTPAPTFGSLLLGGDTAFSHAGAGSREAYSARATVDRTLDFSDALSTAVVSGTAFGFNLDRRGSRIIVAEGYRDGDLIAATTRYRNRTLDGASFDRGTWTIDFFNEAVGGALVDRITLRIGEAPPAAVPEPATWAMMVAGFMMAGGAVRRRRPVAAA